MLSYWNKLDNGRFGLQKIVLLGTVLLVTLFVIRSIRGERDKALSAAQSFVTSEVIVSHSPTPSREEPSPSPPPLPDFVTGETAPQSDEYVDLDEIERFDFNDDYRDFELPDVPLYAVKNSIAWCNETPQQVLEEGKMVLIGGLGGSGSKALQAFCSHFGWLGGLRVNSQGDSRDCFIRNIKQIFRAGGDLENAFYSYRVGREEDIKNTVYKSRCLGDEGFLAEGRGSCFFGFKNSPVVYQMGYFKKIFRQTKLIHIIRDGRDMAFSINNIQTRELGPWVLTNKELKLSMSERQAIFWNRANIEIRKAALDVLGPNNYLAVRIEDLIQPHDNNLKLDTMANIISFLLEKPISHDVVREFADLFDSSSHAMWQSHPPHVIDKITALCKEGLELFGYLEPSKHHHSSKNTTTATAKHSQ